MKIIGIKKFNLVILFLFFAFLNTSCSTTNSNTPSSNLDRFTSVEEVNMAEIFGWEYRENQGMMFLVSATGNKDINSAEIRRLALTRAATVARNKGFQAFTVLDQSAGVTTATEKYTEYDTETTYITQYVRGGGTTQIPFTITVPRTETRPVNVNFCDLLIYLITEEDYLDADNVYLVSDYLSS